MSNRWVVSPDVERVPFDDGREWLELKIELTYGDRRVIRQRMVTGVTQAAGEDGPKYSVDPTAHELATVEAYLVAWSLKGADDKPLDISTPAKKRAVLETVLTEEAFKAVQACVEAHVETVEAKKSDPDRATNLRAECRLMYAMRWTWADLQAVPAEVADAAVRFVSAEVWADKRRE